ncbi:hypothetical protein [Prauserella muralis]|uniref:Uncharacterized protein n=1 Tax=Prauserella muralis TaxID=588067 RepID=A0A2V4AKS3_9PSEU|nr:hypothetical protein [Prauserella muralis]PXY20898.1 hypothetical protein BAY60_25710 [Prauserella muralis]TWE29946.1 hypothetical protein FHX69_2639 [Prauserella muralis]
MAQAITATYVQEDDDWTVKVAGLGKELQGKAPGIIAARDRADQLVEKLAGEGTSTTVVHLLNGSALEFTSAYMTARLARSEPEAEAGEPEQAAEAEEKAEDTAKADTPAEDKKRDDDKPEQPDDAASADEAATAKAGSGARAETPEPPAQRTDEGTSAKKKAKRTVPRKELSKSPEAAAPQQSTGEQAADSAKDTYAAAAAYGTRRSRAAG